MLGFVPRESVIDIPIPKPYLIVLGEANYVDHSVTTF